MGKTNQLADVLSRRFEPAKQWVLPEVLASAKERELPVRATSWYKGACPPSLPPSSVELRGVRRMSV
eukprot:4241878-Amphidinium_carterae.1